MRLSYVPSVVKDYSPKVQFVRSLTSRSVDAALSVVMQ